MLFVIAACLSVWACGNEQQTSENVAEQADLHTEQVAENVNAEQFKEKLNNTADVQLVDVRTPQEWEQGVIGDPYKANINGSDFESKLDALDKDKPVLVY